MVQIADANAVELLNTVANEIKKMPEFKQPEWTVHVKTGCNRERSPQNPDWWCIRIASVLRRIYLNGPVGTERLRSYYGGRKRRGVKPPEFRKSSGKIIRVVLQQLDKAGFLAKEKKGRRISSKGESFLLKMARATVKENQAQKSSSIEHSTNENKSEQKIEIQKNEAKENKHGIKIENKIIEAKINADVK